MQQEITTKLDGKINTASKLDQLRSTELLSIKLPIEVDKFIAKINGDLNKLNLVTIKVSAQKDNPMKGIDLGTVLKDYCRGDYDKTLNPKIKWSKLFTMDKNVSQLPTGIEEIEYRLNQERFDKIKFLLSRAEFVVGTNYYQFDTRNATGALTLKQINNNRIGKMDQSQQDELLNGDLAFCAPSHCFLRYKQEIICQ